ncbi:MAG: hypothetical protein KIT62_11050 [Cyclobacteriaceae bacterium]|nr:hypothetical protein [Cyclobacteriaceae bacterium]
MMTNLFHKDPSLKGINIQRFGGGFVVCIAYEDNGQLTVKSLSSISGDISDECLTKKVKQGETILDEEEARSLFPLLYP